MKRLLLFSLILVLVLGFLIPRDSTEAVAVASRGEERITRILVMGVDRAARLTDSIFIVTVNEAAREARILQIPRDTYANYTDRDYKKLNGALGVLGADGVKDMLSESLGVQIDRYVILDLSCLAGIVDAIGGVDVELKQDIYYTGDGLDHALSAGRQHLDGQGAELLVRFRSGYPNADLGRLDAQKQFLAAFAQKCKSISFTEMLRVAWIALPRVQTDLGVHEIVRLASVLRECDAEHIPMATLAGEAVQGVSGAWYYSLCREKAARMVREYLLADAAEFDPKGLFDRADHPDFHKIYTAPDNSGVGS